ncbi:MAG: aminoglycoside phosphotransferase family protein [Clostridia bacterium]|nr:aminoglycoside phosphotransferase family protein [Clostridia bacterium]
MNDINSIVNNFKVVGDIIEVSNYGNGLINGTFLITCFDGDNKNRYILQMINKNVFKQPNKVMENILKVTDYLRNKVETSREVLTVVHTFDGGCYCYDENNDLWRMYEYIEDSICLDRPEFLEDFYQAGLAFGKFQRYLSDFSPECLNETIPDFHNTPKRYENLLKALKEDKLGRAKDIKAEIEFIKERKDFYSVLIDNNKKGILPLRVSHNDTKMNNVMLDCDSRRALCVIDLDTIMPGFSVTDFGDAIRFGASTAAEDEKDLNKVSMDINLFEIYTKGFIKGCGGQLPKDEIMLLPEGAKMMTIECGMRFLTDYLEGDTYFKTSYPEHNLVRCRTQLKLVADMEEKWDKMKRIVTRFCNL